jgi:uncharacterized membrane protein
LDPTQKELLEIRTLIGELTGRVYRIERSLGIEKLPGERAPTTSTVVRSPESLPGKPLPADVVAPLIPPRPPSPVVRVAEANLESRIGSHWLNRIGITAVLIGVSYFLKFAFDNNWIGAAGRVSIGLIAGIAVVVWSEQFRRRGYRLFSYSLKAVGIGVLYLSLWAAFQVYSLVPGGVAFAAMLIVTSATAAMAITQDAEILAAFALAGGFTTPVLLSTGQNREQQLFAYVAVLDLATLLLVALKPWRRLLLLSYVGSLVLFIDWYTAFYTHDQFRLTLGFATVFFSIFAVAPLVAREPDSEFPLFSALPFYLAFFNAVVYFLQVYGMFEEFSKPATAWFALALAAVYIVLSRQAGAKRGQAIPLVHLHFLHLALAIGFITIAIPIRLDGHWITIGWMVEAGVLLWLANRIHSDFLNMFAIAALAFGVVRLVVIDNFGVSPLIFNARMATYAVAIAVLAAVAWYGSRRTDEIGGTATATAIVALNVLALVALSHEISDYYAQQVSALVPRGARWNVATAVNFHRLKIAEDFSYSALWMVYGSILMVVGFLRRSAFVRWLALLLVAATTVKVFVYDVSQLDRAYRIVSFIVLGILLLSISFVYQRDWLQLSGRDNVPRGESPQA